MVYKHTACCFITADLHLGPLHKHCLEVKDPLLTGSMWMMGKITTDDSDNEILSSTFLSAAVSNSNFPISFLGRETLLVSINNPSIIPWSAV